MSDASLKDELKHTLSQLTALETEARRIATQQLPERNVYAAQTKDGALLLAPIIIAKAQTLAALAQLQRR